MQQIRDDYSGSKLACAERLMSKLGYWWHDETLKSGRSPSPFSIFDSPADNSVLGLMPPLPMRNHIGEVWEEQPQSFRNTCDPDMIDKEVSPHWGKYYPDLKDNWVESGCPNLQGPEKNCYGSTFYEWLLGDFKFRALHEQFQLPEWLMGVRAGFLTPTYASGFWTHEQELHWRFVLHLDENKV